MKIKVSYHNNNNDNNNDNNNNNNNNNNENFIKTSQLNTYKIKKLKEHLS